MSGEMVGDKRAMWKLVGKAERRVSLTSLSSCDICCWARSWIDIAAELPQKKRWGDGDDGSLWCCTELELSSVVREYCVGR